MIELEKKKKEVGMKKVWCFALALLFLAPVVSHAGTVGSRFDVTIGGVVKFDFGVSDQSTGVLQAAGPLGVAKKGTFEDKYGSTIWGAGETGLNIRVAGPEAFGAKTSAFVSGDFTGVWGGGAADDYGMFNLVLATITLDWPNTSLLFGRAGGAWGTLPTFTLQAAWGTNWGGKGPAPVANQITLTQKVAKDFQVKLGLISQVNSITNPWAANDYTRSVWPAVHGGITYSSDVCGKVGPWRLTVGAAGFYGTQKVTVSSTPPYDTERVKMWSADFKFLIPVIPEKNGNKAGALFVDATAFVAQNFDGYFGPWSGAIGTYRRASEYAAPVARGFYSHAGVYLTNDIHLNLFYWYTKVNMSERLATTTGRAEKANSFIASLLYDANPALRFGLQFDTTRTVWGDDTKGRQNNYRFCAWYFF